MNGPNDRPQKRFLEQEVELRRENMRLHGTRFYYYPVDEPPVIEVTDVDREWYQSTWEAKGWEVHE